MECLIGLATNDFVLLAADMTCANQIIVMKDDADKLHKISNNLVMGICGESGDTTQFAEYIAKNIQLYKMRNGYELSPKATAHYTQRNLADYLRSRTPYNVNMLLGGYDEDDGAQLYFIDYLASLAQAKKICHGYGGYFAISVMDRYYRPDLNLDEAYEILKKCVQEVQKRLLINLPNFKVQVIDKNGIRDLPKLSAGELRANS